jgi:esterase/lipase superfamily enzyme
MALRAIPRFELSVRLADSSDVAPKVIDNNGLANSISQHILLLVHGYNNSHDDAETSYKLFIDNIQNQLGDSREAPDAIAKFHWPGDVSTKLGTTVGYPYDIQNARDAAQRLAEFLVSLPIPGHGPASLRITIVGHSMGCRLILEALGGMTSANAPRIQVVGLMAAASPVGFVEHAGRLFNTGNPPRRMLKFFSEQDTVLQDGFPLGQWLAYRLGKEVDNYAKEVGNNAEAVGFHGHPAEFGGAIQRRNKHGEYWKDAYVVKIMVQAIDSTTRTQLPIAETATRSLPAASELAERDLPSRTGPFDRS